MKNIAKRGILFLLTLAVLVVCASCSSKEEESPESLYVKGVMAFQQEKYNKARDYWEKSAEKGCVPALSSLGNFYQMVKGDYVKAKSYWEQAGEQGDASALYELGLLYEYGEKSADIEQDYAKALEYYKQAAEINDPENTYCYEAAAKVSELQAKLNG